MGPAEIIERAAGQGMQLALSSPGKISVKGMQSDVDRWREVITQSKAAIISELQRQACVVTRMRYQSNPGIQDAIAEANAGTIRRQFLAEPQFIHWCGRADRLLLLAGALCRFFLRGNVLFSWALQGRGAWPLPGAVAVQMYEPERQRPAAAMTVDEESTILIALAYMQVTKSVDIEYALEQCRTDFGVRADFVAEAGKIPDPTDYLGELRLCSQCQKWMEVGDYAAALQGELATTRIFTPLPNILQRCAGYLPAHRS